MSTVGTCPPPAGQKLSKTNTSATDRLPPSLGAYAETRTGEAMQSNTGATSPEKAPSKPYQVGAIKSVASVMGRKKTTDLGDNDTKTPDHPTRKSETKASPENKPQVEARKSEKVATKPRGASDTRSDREIGSKNADEILIIRRHQTHTRNPHKLDQRESTTRNRDLSPQPRRPG